MVHNDCMLGWNILFDLAIPIIIYLNVRFHVALCHWQFCILIKTDISCVYRGFTLLYEKDREINQVEDLNLFVR